MVSKPCCSAGLRHWRRSDKQDLELLCRCLAFFILVATNGERRLSSLYASATLGVDATSLNADRASGAPTHLPGKNLMTKQRLEQVGIPVDSAITWNRL
jgi:hypothetical protein